MSYHFWLCTTFDQFCRTTQIRVKFCFNWHRHSGWGHRSFRNTYLCLKGVDLLFILALIFLWGIMWSSQLTQLGISFASEVFPLSWPMLVLSEGYIATEVFRVAVFFKIWQELIEARIFVVFLTVLCKPRFFFQRRVVVRHLIDYWVLLQLLLCAKLVGGCHGSCKLVKLIVTWIMMVCLYEILNLLCMAQLSWECAVAWLQYMDIVNRAEPHVSVFID